MVNKWEPGSHPAGVGSKNRSSIDWIQQLLVKPQMWMRRYFNAYRRIMVTAAARWLLQQIAQFVKA
jgi:hypothetical protein